jgi:hypothetical protein
MTNPRNTQRINTAAVTTLPDPAVRPCVHPERRIAHAESPARSRRSARCLWLFAIGALAIACSDRAPVEPSAFQGNALEYASGTGQLGEVGESLAEPFAVRVLRADNRRPIPNAAVSWVIRSGSGQFLTVDGTLADGDVTLSDADGRASIGFLPASPGVIVVEARLRDQVDGGAIAFTAEVAGAIVSQAAVIEYISGGGQSGKTDQFLDQAFIVRVGGTKGTPLAGEIVTWTVLNGSGTLGGARWDEDAATTVTDSLGLATMRFAPRALGCHAIGAAVRGAGHLPSLQFEVEVSTFTIWVGHGLLSSGGAKREDFTLPLGTTVEWFVDWWWSATFNAHIVSTGAPEGAAFDSGLFGSEANGQWQFAYSPAVTGEWRFVDKIGGATGTLTIY